MTATAFARAIPILRSFDEAKAKEFYVGFLGFAVDFEHRYEPDLPLYMAVSRAGLTLHISEHFGDALPGSAVYIEMTGLREFHAELRAKRYKFARPGIGAGHGGGIGMDLTDPFGNKLRFNDRGGRAARGDAWGRQSADGSGRSAGAAPSGGTSSADSSCPDLIRASMRRRHLVLGLPGQARQ